LKGGTIFIFKFILAIIGIQLVEGNNSSLSTITEPKPLYYELDIFSFAAFVGNISVAEKLLSQNNLTDTVMCRWPITNECVKYPNAQRGDIAMLFAALNNQLHSVQWLNNLGVSLNGVNTKNKKSFFDGIMDLTLSPLEVAKIQGHTALFEWLNAQSPYKEKISKI